MGLGKLNYEKIQGKVSKNFIGHKNLKKNKKISKNQKTSQWINARMT